MDASSVRRVVSTQTRNGRAHISSDGAAPIVFEFPDGLRLTEIWKTRSTPELLTQGSEEPAAGELSLEPPPGGSVFRIADIPPDSDQPSDAVSGRELFEKMGAGHASTGGADDKAALMHRTETIDYGIVLEGEIILVVDDGEVNLKAGDVIIQRGANHAWSNRSGKNCRMAFVMIAAKYP